MYLEPAKEKFRKKGVTHCVVISERCFPDMDDVVPAATGKADTPHDHEAGDGEILVRVDNEPQTFKSYDVLRSILLLRRVERLHPA